MNNRQDNEIVQWFNTIPTCTRWLFATNVVCSIGGTFRVLDISNMAYHLDPVLSRFQIWRIVTCFFSYELNLGSVISLYLLYTYSGQLEAGPVFLGRTADYLYFLIVTMTLSLVLSTIFIDIFLFQNSLIMSIIFLWSQYHRETIVNFFFGFRFKALYLPYVLMVYSFLTSGRIPYDEIVGAISGYIYYYLHDIHPTTGGASYLQTPQFISNFFRVTPASNNAGIYVQPGVNRGQGQTPTGYNWGQGRRLGN